jgi:hypothetical protein
LKYAASFFFSIFSCKSKAEPCFIPPILAILLTVRGDNSAFFWIGDIGDAKGAGFGWVSHPTLAVCVSQSGGLPVLEGVTGVPFFPFF